VLIVAKKRRILRAFTNELVLQKKVRRFIVERLRRRQTSLFYWFVALTVKAKYLRQFRERQNTRLLRRSLKSLRFWKFNKKVEKEEFKRIIISLFVRRKKEYFREIRADCRYTKRLLAKSFLSFKNVNDNRRIKCANYSTIVRKYLAQNFKRWKRKFVHRMNKRILIAQHKRNIFREKFNFWKCKYMNLQLSRILRNRIENLMRRESIKMFIKNLNLIYRFKSLIQRDREKTKSAFLRCLRNYNANINKFSLKIASIERKLKLICDCMRKKIVWRNLCQNQKLGNMLTKKATGRKRTILRHLKCLKDKSRILMKRALKIFAFKKLFKAFLQSKMKNLENSHIIKSKRLFFNQVRVLKNFKQIGQFAARKKEHLCRLECIFTKAFVKQGFQRLLTCSKIQYLLEGCLFFEKRLDKLIKRSYRISFKRLIVEVRLKYLENNDTNRKALRQRAFKALQERIKTKIIKQRVIIIYVLSLLKKGYFSLKTNATNKRLRKIKERLISHKLYFHKWHCIYLQSIKMQYLNVLLKASVVKMIDAFLKLQKFNKTKVLLKITTLNSKKYYLTILLKAFIFSKIFHNLESFLYLKSFRCHFEILKAS
jgi:hypothetical protein